MKSKRVGKPIFFVVMILIVALSFAAFFGIHDYYGDTRKVYIKGADDIRWGIDISGGVEAVFEPDVGNKNITDADMEAAQNIIEKRLNDRKITDHEVYIDNAQHQVIVRFPWTAGESDFDAQAMVDKLSASAIVYFCKNEDNPMEKADSIILQGSRDVASASAGVDNDGNYAVQLKLTGEGKTKFSTATAEMVGQQISIWLGDGETAKMYSAPKVNERIDNGVASITGNFDAESAEDLANTINGGSLPFALQSDGGKLQIISPTLGKNALHVMVVAGSIAFAAVCLLMILRYRLHGVITSLALLRQLDGSIACISGCFPNASSITLTVAGLA
ncbi:MAG: protein translocase subunit SecD, partial [Clostridia bacterium]|nr:protein translocase subunit SecD [Clostridia bacterium]